MPIRGSNESRRLTIEHMKDIASKHGGKCLSEEYTNAHIRLLWECKHGHQWYASPSNILYRKSWCPKCAGNIKYKLCDLQVFARSRGGMLLSNEYLGVHACHEWQCAEGHIWDASFASLRRGDWCPRCKFNFKEEICRLVFEKVFGRKFPKKRPGWLKNENGFQMELDGYCEEFKIAFEYNGVQHYQTGAFGVDEELLSKRKRDDERKIELCRINGVNLEVIDYRQQLGEIQQLISDKYPDHLTYKGPIDFNEVYQHSSVMQRLRDIASNKGGALLSTVYEGGKKSLQWQCSEGHNWQATPEGIIFNDSWCPQCAGNKKLSLDDMKTIAKSRDGECLAEIYINNQTPIQWRCKKGHIWMATASKIRGGTWCPECAKRLMGGIRLTIEDMAEIAKDRNGKCISEIYENSNSKLLWECEQGHRWEATPGHVKQGTWCPYCSGNKKLFSTSSQ